MKETIKITNNVTLSFNIVDLLMSYNSEEKYFPN